jgi:hypothetical protein
MSPERTHMKTLTLLCGLAAFAAVTLSTSRSHEESPVQIRSAADSRTLLNENVRRVSDQLEDARLLALPRPNHGNLVNAVTRGLVSAEFGCVQKLGYSYKAANGKRVHISATVYFPPKAVDKDTVITVKMDNTLLAVKFEPEGIIFRTPGQFVLSATGLNLSAVPTAVPISLYECGEHGAKRKVVASRVWAGPSHDWLVSYGSQIPQASNYVFGVN